VFLRPLGSSYVNEEGTCANISDVHSFTVVSAEQVEMALLSGLQLNAYYDRPQTTEFFGHERGVACLTHGGACMALREFAQCLAQLAVI
jgi:hypothetical protein